MKIVSLFLALAASTWAQFGRNKVQYQTFQWRVISTTHFDIHYAQGGEAIAQHVASFADSLYALDAERIGWRLHNRVAIVLHNSHPSFQQTNIVEDILPEGVGGFTEIFKNRVVVPFDGSYPALDHVVAHELVHAIFFDAFEQETGSRLTGAIKADFPLWFSEGLAEYASMDWDKGGEFFLIDAVTSGYLPSPKYDIGGFLAYRAGRNFLYFLDQSFGAGTVKRLVQEALRTRDFEASFRKVTRINLEDAGELWIRELRFACWPELGRRDHGLSHGRRLTKSGEDGSYWNMQPSLSPDGKRLAWFGDRDADQGLYVGEVDKLPATAPKRILSGGGTPSHESLSPFRSGIAWAPDGRRLVVASLSGGHNVLELIDSRKGKVRKVIDPRMDALSNPDWSRDGQFLTFRGIKDGRSDIYLWSLAKDSLVKVTDDPADDDEPVFSPSGEWIAFSSERDSTGRPTRQRDIWLYHRTNGEMRRLTSDSADETRPSWGGEADSVADLAFLSDRSGLPQAYARIRALSQNTVDRPLTNLLTGVFGARLSPDGSRLVLALFEGGSWDLFLMDRSRLRASDSALPLTRFALSRADSSVHLYRPLVRENLESFKPDTSHADSSKPDSLAKRDSLPRRTPPAHRFGDDRLFGLDPDEQPLEPLEQKTARQPVDTTAFLPNAPRRDSLGQAVSARYKSKWSLDNAALALGYNNLSGTAGQGFLTFSDLLGDQSLQVSLNMQGSIENANAYVRYGWLPWKTDLYVGAYHLTSFTGNLNLSTGNADLFSDRQYAAMGSVVHPLSMFHRVQFDASIGGLVRTAKTIDADGSVIDDTTRSGLNTSPQWIQGEGSWVFDNVAWGVTGPVDGIRTRLSVSSLPPVLQDRWAYLRAKADVRAYTSWRRLYSIAVRGVAGASRSLDDRENPHRFLVGGDEFNLNYHINQKNAGVDVPDVYFSEWDMPLRGYRYLQFRGDKELLGNLEFRFPFVEEARFGILLPPIRYLMGVVFLDAAAAWSSGSFEEQSGIGLGYGLRMNLGGLILRWSIAWPQTTPTGSPTNPQTVGTGSFQYWSLGADF